MSETIRQGRGWGRAPASIAAAALLIVLGLAFAPLARAAYDPIGSGTTKLRLEKSFLAFLKANKLKLAASAPARLKAGTLTLPVSGGLIDPTTGKGTIEQQGALVFQGARKKVPLKDIVLKTKHSPLIAKVGGSQLKVATSARLHSSREGFGSGFSAKKLKLSAKVAERLNKKLRPAQPFTAGQLIGSTASATQPQTATILPSGKATLLLDPETVAKLNALFVSVNPIFPAEHVGPSFTLPIIPGGAIAPDAGAGTLETGGSLEFLQLGGAQIFWHEFWFDLTDKLASPELDVEPSPPYAGKAGRTPILDLNLPAATVSANPGSRTITVTGTPVTLLPPTATLFDQAFAEGKEVFKPGDLLGTVSFSAQAQ